MSHLPVLASLTVFYLQTCSIHLSSGIPAAHNALTLPAASTTGPKVENFQQYAINLGNQIAALLRTQIELLGKLSREPPSAVGPSRNPAAALQAGVTLVKETPVSRPRTEGRMIYHPNTNNHRQHTPTHQLDPNNQKLMDYQESESNSQLYPPDKLPFSLVQESIEAHKPSSAKLHNCHAAVKDLVADFKPSAGNELVTEGLKTSPVGELVYPVPNNVNDVERSLERPLREDLETVSLPAPPTVE